MVGKMFINYRTLKLIFFVIIGCISELVIWAAVTSMAEINARGDDRGIVPTSSNVELIFTLNIDRSRAEPGEEIKTIEITIPPGFTIGDLSSFSFINILTFPCGSSFDSAKLRSKTKESINIVQTHILVNVIIIN